MACEGEIIAPFKESGSTFKSVMSASERSKPFNDVRKNSALFKLQS